jgi:hypothetical protein
VTSTRRAVLLAVCVASAAAATTGRAAVHSGTAHPALPTWGPAITTWHLPIAGPNQLGLVDKQVGIASSASQYVDDTKLVTYADINGNTETTDSSAWTVMDVTKVGVPRTAKAIRLGLKGIITKGQSEGLAVVYVMIRPYDSTCCQGPPGFRNYPVDIQMADGRQVETVLETVLQHPADGRRDWASVDVSLRNGKFEYAWGYRRVDGDWPAGDGVAFEMFANGYGS